MMRIRAVEEIELNNFEPEYDTQIVPGGSLYPELYNPLKAAAPFGLRQRVATMIIRAALGSYCRRIVDEMERHLPVPPLVVSCRVANKKALAMQIAFWKN